jgi:hypothetical protein
MSAVAPVRSTAVAPANGPTASTSPSNTDLLPEGASMTGMQGVTEALYLLVGKLASLRERQGKMQAEGKYADRNRAITAGAEARNKAVEASKKGGFIDAIVKHSGLIEIMSAVPGVSEADAKELATNTFKGALVVGSLVATVMTAGTGAALAVAAIGVALSYGGQAVASSGVFGKEASQYIGIGMQIAGAGCMVAAGFVASGSTLAHVGAIINGGIAVVNGADQVVTSVNQYAADEHNIEAVELDQTIKRLEKQIEDLIDQLKEDKEVLDKTRVAANETIEALDKAQFLSLQPVRA